MTAGQKADIAALLKDLGEYTIIRPKTRYEADRLIRRLKIRRSFNEHPGRWTRKK